MAMDEHETWVAEEAMELEERLRGTSEAGDEREIIIRAFLAGFAKEVEQIALASKGAAS